jgi:hypothetical protein
MYYSKYNKFVGYNVRGLNRRHVCSHWFTDNMSTKFIGSRHVHELSL